jgi:hypothetical protein
MIGCSGKGGFGEGGGDRFESWRPCRNATLWGWVGGWVAVGNPP